jgi:hypothetical protein
MNPELNTRLRAGLELVEALAPLAATIPGAGENVAAIASGLAQIGQAALNVHDGLNATNLTELSDLTIALQAQNDALAAQVAAS